MMNKLNITKFKFIVGIIVFVVSFFAISQTSFAVTETRWYRADSHIINGLNALQLGTSSSYNARFDTTVFGAYNCSDVATWLIDIFKRDANGTETPLGGGTIAQYSKSGSNAFSDYIYTKWNAPQTNLSPTDSIIVIETLKMYGNSSNRKWITPQLNARQLNSAQWTFKCYLFYQCNYYNSNYKKIWWGLDYGQYSKIENFSYNLSCNLPNTQPYSTCQNGSCVSIDACGVSTCSKNSDCPPMVSLFGPVTTIIPNPINLNWTSTNADSCVASSNWSGSKTVNGNESVSSTNLELGDNIFTLTCTGLGGSASSSATVTLLEGAQSCSIDQSIGFVNAFSGSYKVSPKQTTTYTLTCGYNGATSTFQTTVTYTPPPKIATLTSSIFDTAVLSGAAINSIMWQGVQPNETNVQFQIASSNSPSGPWDFFGPDCSTSIYYNPQGPNIQAPISLKCNNKRYFQYKVFLTSDPNRTSSPIIDDIIVNYSP